MVLVLYRETLMCEKVLQRSVYPPRVGTTLTIVFQAKHRIPSNSVGRVRSDIFSWIPHHPSRRVVPSPRHNILQAQRQGNSARIDIKGQRHINKMPLSWRSNCNVGVLHQYAGIVYDLRVRTLLPRRSRSDIPGSYGGPNQDAMQSDNMSAV